MPSRVLRIIAVIVAATVVVGTGVAWSKIRSFESGINHISSAALGGGGEDGAIDILLVGMDSRTDAHGNPLSQEELATLRAGDDEATNTDTIILVRIPNNGKSATAISIPRDSYVDAPGVGRMKINGVYGSVHLEKLKKLVEDQGVDPSVAEPEATEAGREALIKTVANLTGVTVDHYAEIGLLGFALITDALGGVNVCLKDAVYEPLSGADFAAGWQKTGFASQKPCRSRTKFPSRNCPLFRLLPSCWILLETANLEEAGKSSRGRLLATSSKQTRSFVLSWQAG